VILSASQKVKDLVESHTLEQVCESENPELQCLVSRFLCTIHLLCFFRSQKCYNGLSPLFFLLHYRGLSNTGFHLLNSLGLSPVPKTVSKSNKRFTNLQNTSLAKNSVVWFDNLRRHQTGWIHTGAQVDHTVIAQTLIPKLPRHGNNQPDVLFDEVPILLWKQASDAMKDSKGIQIILPGSFLANTNELSIPLRCKTSCHFEYREIDVLPIKCGEIRGTLQVLEHLREIGFWRTKKLRALVADYDLWWRIQRLVLSNSFIGSLETFRKRTIFIQGPWHLYKVLAEAFWKKFGPLFAYSLFLAGVRTANPTINKTPELKVITEVLISIFAWSLNNPPINSSCVESYLIKVAIGELVPLVGHDDSLLLWLLIRCTDSHRRSFCSSKRRSRFLSYPSESTTLASCTWMLQLFSEFLTQLNSLLLLEILQSPCSWSPGNLL
jgi:hypothetical protein